jgi:tricorn protease
MWYGQTIYFLADHDAARRANIWACDLATHRFRQVTHFTDYDVDFPSLGDSGIVFQQAGRLYVLDLPTEQLHPVEVRVPDDGMHTRARFVDARKFLRDVDPAQMIDYDLAPNGKRALFVARGDLFSVPAEHGSTRNLTESSGAEEDHPAWSPDGAWVAYTTDASGGQQVAVRPALGGEERILTRFSEGYRYQPAWAPGGDKLAFSDNEHRLWYVPVAGGEPRQVAEDPYQEIHDYRWSPDGLWLAYSLTDRNQIRSIWFYSLASGKATRVSASRDNDYAPAFDPEGKYLYFISARHENPVLSESEFEVANLKSTGIYVATLAADGVAPFAPRSDEGAIEAPRQGREDGKAAAAGGDAGARDEWKPGASKPLRVDLDALVQRAVPLPVPAAVVSGLEAVKGRVYYQTSPLPTIEGKLPGEKSALHAFDMVERKDAIVIGDLDGYRLSANGEKLLYKKDKDWFIVDAKAGGDGAAKSHEEKKPLALANLRVLVEPRREWAEMFESAWRLERDFFYNTRMNGVDWPKVRAAYEKLLPLVGSREDLNYLIGEMQGELGNSHTYVGGGDQDDPTARVATGLLGADYFLDAASGRYYFARIYPGDNTREAYRSPLLQPGAKIKPGDFLLAVDGHELKAPMDPYQLFVGKGEQNVRLTVADAPAGARRDVVVEPVKSELNLREQAWIEHNRDLVDRLSGGRVGYVYLSNMEELGMDQFLRQFFNQSDKLALIVDDRWNGGGFIDQLVLARLRRTLVGMSTNRALAGTSIPQQLVNGPKVCLVNHYSASDGDMFPFYFRKYGLGPLIGTRTWGGVRGIRGPWPLLDGGYITVPEDSVYGLDSQWVMENRGVVPDIEVDDAPREMLAGRDPQIEAAVRYLLDGLGSNPGSKPGGLPPPPPLLPAYPPPGHE